MDNNQVLSGTDGFVYINGELLSELKSIELKVTGKFEEFTIYGDYSTYNKYTGYSIDGTIKLQKIMGRGISLLSSAYQSGVMPDIKIITCLTNQNTGASERTAVSGVVLTEFTLANFESKALVEEELPIKASSYEILETLS
jgi:hypothetical protein